MTKLLGTLLLVLFAGAAAAFSFATAPRVGGAADVSVSDGVNAADQPNGAAPAPKTQRGLTYMAFQGTDQVYVVTLTMKVSDGSAYTTGPVNIRTPTANGARDVLHTFLENNDWKVARGGQQLSILGKKNATGKILAIKSLTYSITPGHGGRILSPPFFGKAGDVTVTRGVNLKARTRPPETACARACSGVCFRAPQSEYLITRGRAEP